MKAEMNKKKDKDQNWLEHNFAMAKIEFSDKSLIIKNTF